MKNLLPIILILLSGLLFFLFINPSYMEVKQIRSDVAVYGSALSSAKELEGKRDALMKNFNAISSEDKTKLDRFLPNTVDNIQLILQIQKIASDHGLNIKNIKFDAPTAENTDTKSPEFANQQRLAAASGNKQANLPYGIFKLEFGVDARYEKFTAFLQDLEYNIRLVGIKNISFSVPNADSRVARPTGSMDANDPNVYTFTLKIETYWLK
jgi:Tfp pilus assembly protein PilO